MTLKNRTSRQENEENDMKIFKNQDMNITLEKGSVQDSCYDDTFLVSLLFDHKGLVCKNTAVGVDELTGRAFDPEAWCILAYYICQSGPFPTVSFSLILISWYLRMF